MGAQSLPTIAKTWKWLLSLQPVFALNQTSPKLCINRTKFEVEHRF